MRIYIIRYINEKRREVNFSPSWYPDPGSNRDGLLHWCLRPARLPIPPSGHCGCKGTIYFLMWQAFFVFGGVLKVYCYTKTAKKLITQPLAVSF